MSGTHGTFAPSAEQQAVLDRAGLPTVLVAAAGSGKTSVLTWLYSRAHVQDQLPTSELLAITFTNRAAGELRSRIAAELQQQSLDGRAPDLSDAWIGTFHGICARLLREFAHERGIDPAFGIIEELDARELQAEAWEQAVQSLLDDLGGPAAELLAQLGERALREAAVSWWSAQRSAGRLHPKLPIPAVSAERVAAAHAELARPLAAVQGIVSDLIADGRTGARIDQAQEALTAIEAAAARVVECTAQEPVDPAALAAILAELERSKPSKAAPLAAAAEAIDELLAARTVLAARAVELLAVPQLRLIAELVERFSFIYAERKAEQEALDHDDLELQALELLRGSPVIAAKIAGRFSRIFVDEYQDTNERQHELVGLLAGGGDWLSREQGALGRAAVTIVGDPRQAIYGFRHATVRLIQEAEAQAPAEARTPINTNRRSDGEVLGAIDAAWAQLVDGHLPVDAGRGRAPLPESAARVELLITRTETAEPWDPAELGGRSGDRGYRLAEARLVAHRIAELRAQEPEASVAVLARTRAALGPIAAALADRELDAVLDGAEGFWERPEIADLLAWLRLVRNPEDDAALIAVLASPLVGLSAEGLALAGTLRRTDPDAPRSRWARLAQAAAAGAFAVDDARRLAGLVALAGAQRLPGRASDPAGLIEEVVAATGFDEHLQRLAEPQRRLANLARLRRLAEQEAARGGDLTSLLDRTASEQRHGLRAPEAALGGQGAVQLMTIHQAKGLEFDTVIVAGLGGRGNTQTPDLVGDAERVGLRWREAPKAPSRTLFAFDALIAEQQHREREELLRVMYVALTRARDCLIVSGVAEWKKDGPPFAAISPADGGSATAITWLAPALAPDLDALLDAAEQAPVRSLSGVQVVVSSPAGPVLPAHARAPERAEPLPHRPEGPRGGHAAAVAPLAPPQVLSYTALAAHQRCGLREYAAGQLRLPSTEPLGIAGDGADPAEAPPVAPTTLRGKQLGTVVHAVLEQCTQSPLPDELQAAAAREAAAIAAPRDDEGLAVAVALAQAAVQLPVWAELWETGAPRRELPFTIAVGGDGHMLTGIVDAQVHQPGGEVLVVDYKTDQVPDDVPLDAHVQEQYALQRAAYALAALRGGAARVRVAHLFLRRAAAGNADAVAEFVATPADAAALDAALARACGVVASGERAATAAPDAWVCDGCPARGRLCGWPVAVTRRPPGAGAADRSAWLAGDAVVRGS